MPHDVTIVYAHDIIDGPDAFDVVAVAKQLEGALVRLGHTVTLHDIQPDASSMPNLPVGSVVFNLIERINGSDALAADAVACLEQMGLVLTGTRASHFSETANKVQAKKVMQAYGVPVLPSYTEEMLKTEKNIRLPLIVKSSTEHASVGIDEKSVVTTAADALTRIAACKKKWGGQWFAEPYVDGREFNISVLQRGHDVDVLPVAEMKFVGYPEGMPKLVDFGAKWDENTFSYNHTIRSFTPEPGDEALWERLAKIAKQTWDAFGFCGYARVDIRVDNEGNPWVLEINADPSLEEDAGFAAAAAQAGMRYDDVIGRIVKEAVDNAVINNMTWRTAPVAADAKRVRELTKATGFFTDEEVKVAGELVEETVRGEEDYRFMFAENNKGKLAGYVCYGNIPLTENRYDLYWIAVHPDMQKNRLGQTLIKRTLAHIRGQGGDRLYAETSGKEQYAGTRRFYEKAGFVKVAELPDFYRPGDDKVIYCYVA